MTTPFLDCRHELSEVRSTPADRWAWIADEISDDHWLVPVDDDMQQELSRLADFIADNPLQNLQRKITDVLLPCCTSTYTRMKTILRDGTGFAVLNRLPIDQYPIEIVLEIYWLLGQLIGPPVAQKWSGQMIYDVRDAGTPFGYGVRGSYTSVELNFHTDNAFARMVPDYVGLFCRNTAKSGGISRFCSLYAVHHRMMKTYPQALARLYQPMFFDRQKEHHENAAKVTLAPYFSWNGNYLNARANSSLVRKGYQVAQAEMDSALADALDAVDEISTQPEIWYEAPLQRGQVQYLNNHEVGHYRSEVIDHQEQDRKRHLYRLWHREQGTACYDGGSMKNGNRSEAA